MLVQVESVESVLKETIENSSLTDILILGYKEDGSLFVRSSYLTNASALFMLEKAKLDILTTDFQ